MVHDAQVEPQDDADHVAAMPSWDPSYATFSWHHYQSRSIDVHLMMMMMMMMFFQYPLYPLYL